MKIWEALIYGLVAGLTGLLPVSFSGHAAVLQDAFALSPLTQAGDCTSGRPSRSGSALRSCWLSPESCS